MPRSGIKVKVKFDKRKLERAIADVVNDGMRDALASDGFAGSCPFCGHKVTFRSAGTTCPHCGRTFGVRLEKARL